MAGQREIVLCFLSVPADANFGGKVHGGTVMKWMDEAGYACAAACSGPYCVTAFVGEIDFERPIAIGSLVQVHARVLHTGRSSMQVYVTVSSADPKVGQYAMTTRSFTVFVAVGSDGRPVPVPPFLADRAEDQELAQHAHRLYLQRHREAAGETLAVQGDR
jgi:acyl-CoA hydrolase